MPELKVYTQSGMQTIPFNGHPLLYDLIAHLPDAPDRPCGGNGSCGKCRVTAKGSLSEALSANSTVPACRTYLTGDAAVWLPKRHSLTQIEVSLPPLAQAVPAGKMGHAAAVDLGTTSIVYQLYDRSSGKVLATVSCENPQRAAAADVIGRIESALKGHLPVLTGMVRGAVDALEAQALASAGLPEDTAVEARVVAGNTTMLYLYTGRNPECLSHAPFAADCLFGHSEGSEIFPACMGAFVGADITCGVLASGMCESEATSMLIDVGTNGEIVLWHKGKLYCCATAAGPAFEGAGISCGVGSVPGAIDSAIQSDGQIEFTTIGAEWPCGICGSGLIDLTAALLDAEIMDETGALEGTVILADSVSLNQQDIRQVQLAKGAIAAGMQALMKCAGVQAADVQKLYIAGGFGSRMNLQSAERIGLIPGELARRAEVLGNASLGGARMLLINEDMQRRAQQIAAMAQCINLAEDADFSDLFIENMMFE